MRQLLVSGAGRASRPGWNQQKDAGRTDAEIKAALKSYDAWDRYDHDGDGNFNESDGYLDHFQIVHAGGDQSDGDRYQGEDAIWSHRWRAFQGGQEGSGPPNFPIGGTQIGDTGLWVADYTMQAENGGLSVVAHEYGHDLGLPDHYDTASPEDNAVNWWTLMGQSRLRAGSDVGVGTRPADLGVWDKLALGWLDYEVADAGQETTRRARSARVQLGEAAGAGRSAAAEDGADRRCPRRPRGAPQWWSGSWNAYTSGLTRQIDVPAGEASAHLLDPLQHRGLRPEPCDYAYVEVNDGNGLRRRSRVTSPPRPRATASRVGATAGCRRSFDLSAYAGKTMILRFRYATNGGTKVRTSPPRWVCSSTTSRSPPGQTTIFADGAEDGRQRLELGAVPQRSARRAATSYRHFYLASYRTYVSYDRYLQTGPYNLGWWPSRPQKADFFPYQNGLLVNYWDTQYVRQRHLGAPRARPGSCRSTRIRPRSTISDGEPVARADPDLRRAVLAASGRTRWSCTTNGRPSLRPWGGRAAAVRRHPELLERRAAATSG